MLLTFVWFHSLFTGSVFMFARIILTLSSRANTILSDQGDGRNDEIARQVSRMLIINGSVFFLFHLPVSMTFLESIDN